MAHLETTGGSCPYLEAATDFSKWQQFADPDGEWTIAQFKETPVDHKVWLQYDANGPEEFPGGYSIEPSCILPDDPLEWILLCNGFQVGGNIDRSGAGDLSFSSYEEALSFYTEHRQGSLA